MAQNNQFQRLHNDDSITNKPETDDIEVTYKEIKDRNSPSPCRDIQKDDVNIIGSPINCDVQVIPRVLDENVLTVRDIVPCPTCRGAGTIQAGMY